MTPEESQNRRNIRRAQREIEEEFRATVDEIFAGTMNLKFGNNTFKLSENPVFARKLEKALDKFRVKLELILANGISAGFDISAKNFTDVVYKAFDGRTVIPAVKDILSAQLEEPLKAFLNRTIDGLSLSDRVWNITNQFQSEIEYTIFTGLSEQKSAQQMAADLKRYLNNPDKLFRRVRNAKGNLVLSKPAKEFTPGQGVYRSSYKNSMRVARTEINTAYRTADHVKFAKTPFVLGIEIRLSLAHPKFDICDYLVGVYPADFKFVGWHPQCLCYAVPILPSREEFNAYQDATLRGEKYEFGGKVKDIPEDARNWIAANAQKISRWKSQPAFLKDNRGYFTRD